MINIPYTRDAGIPSRSGPVRASGASAAGAASSLYIASLSVTRIDK